jgi:transposase
VARDFAVSASFVRDLARRMRETASMIVPGSTDAEVFLRYVEKVLVPCLWPGAVVVLDNLSTHKVTGVAEAIESAGARLYYLPPYSPDLNPIEQAWE